MLKHQFISLYDTASIQLLEKRAMDELKIPATELMERAGSEAFKALKELWPNAKHISVFCGRGNNGGDGYVLARIAHEQGLEVKVVECGNAAVNPLSSAASHARLSFLKTNLTPIPYAEDVELKGEVLVDALFGIGFKGPLKQEFAKIISKLNQTNLPIFAIDVPSGLDASTGGMTEVAIKASATITFMGAKQGLVTGFGPSCTGKVVLSDLGLPSSLFSKVPATSHLMSDDLLKNLPPRQRAAHKGDFGHVLIVGGGDSGFAGAPLLSGMAALRAGAGLVSLAIPPESYSRVGAGAKELMCHAITDANSFSALLARATVVVIGPGLGQSSWAYARMEQVCASSLPLVMDADALNILSHWLYHDKKTLLPHNAENWLLTPHPGEAGRLLNTDTPTIQQNRFIAAEQIASKVGANVILKGAGTIVYSWPKEKKEGSSFALCSLGNPGMATAGTGDVLSGILGALIAQKLPLPIAAELGVFIHAKAGDLAAEQGGERGLIASDLFPFIHTLVNPHG